LKNTHSRSRTDSINYTDNQTNSENTEYYQYNEQSIVREEQLIVQARTETRSVQEEIKKYQEHKILFWFTLPKGLFLVLRQPTKISTEKITEDQFYTIQYLQTASNHCSQQQTTYYTLQ